MLQNYKEYWARSISARTTRRMGVSQKSYSLVVILEFSGVSEVQYKEIMITGDE